MIFAHAFIGAIIAYIATPKMLQGTEAEKFWKLNKKSVLWLFAILSSVFPDLDILYVLLIDNSAEHRKLLTHSIVPYTIILILVLLIIKIKKIDKYYSQLTLISWLGVLFHLIADLYVAPVYLFTPISNVMLLWQPFHINLKDGIKAYIFSPYMLTELIIIITGTILLIKSFINEKKELIILLSILGMILISAIGTLIPFISSFN